MAPLLVPADFRPTTSGLAAHEAVARYALSASEANDTDLAATIDRMTTRLQELTGDDFIAATETLKLSPISSSPKLFLPKRASAITQVATRDDLGTLTVQLTTAYRASLSLNSGGTDFASPRVEDHLYVLPRGTGITGTLYGPWVWPCGVQVVEVTGTFGWTTPPGDILRALAGLVWNHYKPQRLDLGMVTRITAEGETLEVDTEGATGLVEVDSILRRFDRFPKVVLA